MYKGINEFKKGYQPHAYVIKKQDGIIVADTISIVSRWDQFFSNLLNVNQGMKEVKYSLQSQLSQNLVELAIENVKKHKAPE